VTKTKPWPIYPATIHLTKTLKGPWAQIINLSCNSLSHKTTQKSLGPLDPFTLQQFTSPGFFFTLFLGRGPGRGRIIF